MPDEQNPANVPLVYANNVRLSVSFSDFRIYFGEFIAPNTVTPVGQMTQAQGLMQVDRVCIAISPDLIPSVVDGLKKALETYTSQFGELRKVPDAMVRSLPGSPAREKAPGEIKS